MAEFPPHLYPFPFLHRYRPHDSCDSCDKRQIKDENRSDKFGLLHLSTTRDMTYNLFNWSSAKEFLWISSVWRTVTAKEQPETSQLRIVIDIHEDTA